jgi:hypothetical protein
MSAADKATFRTHMSILDPNANNNGSTGNEMGYLISGYAERILKAFDLHTGALATNNNLNRPPVQLYPEQLLAAPSTLEFASYLKAGESSIHYMLSTRFRANRAPRKLFSHAA